MDNWAGIGQQARCGASFYTESGCRALARAMLAAMSGGPPTPRSTIRRLGGAGDVPLRELRWRCANCRSRLTDFVATGGADVQPW